jgi:hypothetical protein
MRVICRGVANTGPHTMRGRARKYIALRDPKKEYHCFDVPLSLWQGKIPEGPYRDNGSICHDVQATRIVTKAPLIFMVVPWRGAKPAAAPMPQAEQATPILAFKKLAEATGAPPVIMQAVELLLSNLQPSEIETALMESVAHVEAERQEAPPEPAAKTAGKSNAERQREFRAKKKAEKEAAKLAASQGF